MNDVCDYLYGLIIIFLCDNRTKIKLSKYIVLVNYFVHKMNPGAGGESRTRLFLLGRQTCNHKHFTRFELFTLWPRYQESNLDLNLRSVLFYPLNYSEVNIDSDTRVLVEVTTPQAAQALQRLLL